MIADLCVGMIVHSLNHNNIGRVYPFLRAFVGVPGVQVKLAGWDETGTLSKLLDGLPWPIARLRGPVIGMAAERALAAAVEGCHVLHCFKNRDHLRTTLAVAHAGDRPLVLDVDDWELGLYLEGVAHWPRWRQILWGGPITRHIQNALQLEILARTTPAALSVNSTALQAYYGGTLTYTAADADTFDPQRADGKAFRRAHGLPASDPVIGFLGTPHPHKGIDQLLQAFAIVRRSYPEAHLLFVGVPGHNRYRPRLLGTPGVIILDYIQPDAYADAYAACDVIAVPQRPVTEGIMQTPAKLILAMAAGRPIVATRVGDIPSVLRDAGQLIPPDDIAALACAIIQLLQDSARRDALGVAARGRFLESFTLMHLREQLFGLYTAVRRDPR